MTKYFTIEIKIAAVMFFSMFLTACINSQKVDVRGVIVEKGTKNIEKNYSQRMNYTLLFLKLIDTEK